MLKLPSITEWGTSNTLLEINKNTQQQGIELLGTSCYIAMNTLMILLQNHLMNLEFICKLLENCGFGPVAVLLIDIECLVWVQIFVFLAIKLRLQMIVIINIVLTIFYNETQRKSPFWNFLESWGCRLLIGVVTGFNHVKSHHLFSHLILVQLKYISK